jgi:tetratricopeptide (TPR) repeat protein
MQIINTSSKFSTGFFLCCLLHLSGTANANGIPDTEDPETLYVSAVTDYESKKYEDSIKKLQVAVEKEPDVSKYHHILAVSYGREAENVNWFKAMDYAKLTLKHLERANELDPNNLEILDDLMDFYHEAPGFLGGDTKKGDEIAALIKKLTLENRKSEEK